MGMEMKFEPLHMVQYLERLIDDGNLKLAGEVPLRVTYHYPCHLGRHLGDSGIDDSPRNVLSKIKGLEPVEMERNRENAWCCGAGAGVSQANPDLALWTANERPKEAAATGAMVLITACPWCERSFKDAAKEYGQDIEIYDIAEIACKAL